ncbi:helix-turn-helix domain-containing protein [Homoserinimonas sp. A520]
MLADPAAAVRFIKQEIGPLLGRSQRLGQIRDTLRLYLAEGNSLVAVAQMLHLAPNTVAYRVSQSSELLGRAVSKRSQQILLALQLFSVVEETELDPTD